MRHAVIVVVALLLVAGCGAPARSVPSQAATASASGSSAAVEAARSDLGRLLRELEAIHPEPFHGIPRGQWVSELEALSDRLDQLSPEQAEVALMRLVALLSREGRDGHQFALPVDGAQGPVLPLRMYEFAEGVFVTDALAPYRDLVGAQVLAIGDHPMAEVLAALEPLVPRDGPATVPGFRPAFLLRTDVLRGLDLIGEGAASLTVRMPDGSEASPSVEPVAWDQWLAWGGDFGMLRLPWREGLDYLDVDEPFAFAYLPAARALYVRYSAVQRVDPGAVAAMAERAAADDVERVVVDLRQNPGGDNHNYPPLLDALAASPAAANGRLFVLTDRVTFSAAANFATELEGDLRARFVGEPMGGGLNFWDDVDWVELPDYPVPMQVGVSTRYWQMAEPDDPRLTIEPEIAVEARATDYFAGRDPALDAALSAGGS